MTDCVLDASCILALLNAEEGAELVQSLLPHSFVSAVNLAEVVSRLTLIGMPAEEVSETVNLLGLETVPFDEKQSFEVGFLSAATKPLGLSLGDRACLALARLSHCTAVTADRAWAGVKIGVEIKLIR